MEIIKALKKNQKKYSMYLILMVIFLIFGFMTDFTNFKDRNVTNILIQNSYVFILSMGMVLVIITGNIDLSVGSLVALTGAVSAMTYNATKSILITFIVTVIVGVIAGGFQGFWIAYMKVPAFIVTLAGMLLFRGLTMIVTNIKPVGLVDDRFKLITNGYVPFLGRDSDLLIYILAGIIVVFVIFMNLSGHKKRKENNLETLPLPLLVIKLGFISLFILWLASKFAGYKGVPNVAVLVGVIGLIFTFIMNNTVFGRSIYAVGGNAKSAKLSGIESERVIFLVFVIIGGLAGLAGLVYTSYVNQALSNAGNMFELDAISSAFIGGASATGGVGSIMGSIIGALVMGVINNGMILMSLGAQYQQVVKGAVLLLAVWYDLYYGRKGRD